VLGGAAVTVVGASHLIYLVVLWLLFAVDEALAAHFAAVPVALSTLAVGGVVWGYHRAVVRERAPSGTWTGPQRVYQHLLVAVGMVTTAAGAATVLTFGLEVLLPARVLVETTDLGRRELATGLTLLLVGVPLWWTNWTKIERVVRGNPRERRTTPRRALIFGAFGLTTLVAVGAWVGCCSWSSRRCSPIDCGWRCSPRSAGASPWCSSPARSRLTTASCCARTGGPRRPRSPTPSRPCSSGSPCWPPGPASSHGSWPTTSASRWMRGHGAT
jgi:hypothetical protein